jgi:hypothetical protein
LAVMTAMNIRDAAQAEAARLRMELEGMGRSLPSCFWPVPTYGSCSRCSVLTPHVLVDADSRMEVRCLTKQLHGA